MAKKRKAEEQISGVPVNKRKSLLMKPRHYSPSVEGKGENEDKAELQDDSNILKAGIKGNKHHIEVNLVFQRQSGVMLLLVVMGTTTHSEFS